MRHLIAAAVLCLAVFIGGAASAQTTVTVEWLGEQSPAAASQHTYSLNYTISGGGVDNVAFSVTLPLDFAVMGISRP
jgi:hypothetical protein